MTSIISQIQTKSKSSDPFLGLSIYQYRQQTSAVIDDLIHIIESLEI